MQMRTPSMNHLKRHIYENLRNQFAESKNSAGSDGGYNGGGSSRPAAPASAGDGFMNIPDGIDEELPFN